MWSMSRGAIGVLDFPCIDASTGLPLGVAAMSAVQVIRHFDQVAVGVTEVHGPDGSRRAGLCNRSFDDDDVALLQVCDDVGERRRGDQAEIDRAGCRSCRL